MSKSFIENIIEDVNKYRRPARPEDNDEVYCEEMVHEDCRAFNEKNPESYVECTKYFINEKGRVVANIKFYNPRYGRTETKSFDFPIFFDLVGATQCLLKNIHEWTWELSSATIWCEDLSMLSKEELQTVCKLFDKLSKSDLVLPKGSKIVARYNTRTKQAFFCQADDWGDYRAWTINPKTDQIEEWYMCGNCGAEGFKEDLNKCEECKEYTHEED